MVGSAAMTGSSEPSTAWSGWIMGRPFGQKVVSPRGGGGTGRHGAVAREAPSGCSVRSNGRERRYSRRRESPPPRRERGRSEVCKGAGAWPLREPQGRHRRERK